MTAPSADARLIPSVAGGAAGTVSAADTTGVTGADAGDGASMRWITPPPAGIAAPAGALTGEDAEVGAIGRAIAVKASAAAD
jgi:hypothetical protein